MNHETWLVAACVMQVLDYVTTMHILSLGGRELNPAIRKLMSVIGEPEALLLKGVVVILACDASGVEALRAVTILMLPVIVWNALVIRKLRASR